MWQAPGIALACIPPVLVLYAIAVFGVNVPYLDEWRFPYELKTLAGGGSPLHILWQPNVDHRIVFPRLIAFPLLALTGYDSRALMAVSWFATALILLLYYRAAPKRTSDGSTRLLPAVFASALLFSFVHYATWTGGFQFTFVLTNLAAIAGIVCLSATSIAANRRIAGSALLFVVSSFSSLHGFLGWPVALVLTPAVIPCGHRKKASLVLAAAMMAAVILHVATLDGSPRETPDPAVAFKRPLDTLRFFFCLAGAPLAQGLPGDPELIALAAGILAVTAFLLLCAGAYAARRKNLAGLCGIGLFCCGFMAMAAIGRMPWGSYVAATTSRYMCQSVLLWCAIIFLSWSLLTKANQRSVAGCAAGVVFTLSVLGSIHGAEIIRDQYYRRSAAAALLPFLPQVDRRTDDSEHSPLFPLFDIVPLAGRTVRASYEALQGAGLRPAAKAARFDGSSGLYCGVIETTSPPAGKVNAGQIIKAAGWAAFSERSAPGGFVVFTTGADTKIIAAATVGSAKTDWLAEYYHQPALASAGWEVEIPAGFLQPGPNRIRAWLYDPVDESFRLLHDPGEPVFQLTE